MFHTCFWGKHDVTYAVALVAIVAHLDLPFSYILM